MKPASGIHPKVMAVITEYVSGGSSGTSPRMAGTLPSGGSTLPKPLSARGRVALNTPTEDPPFIDRGNALLKARGKMKIKQEMNQSVKNYVRMLQSNE
jgi:hypothetical protein